MVCSTRDGGDRGARSGVAAVDRCVDNRAEAGLAFDVGVGGSVGAGEHVERAAAATVPSMPVATDITGEPVQYSAPVTNDDMLMSLAEKGS